jgi:hypothetical protein
MDDLATSERSRRLVQRLHALGGGFSDGVRRLTLRVARKP